MSTKKSFLPCLVFAILALGCSKEKTVSEQDQFAAERASQEYLLAESIFENVFQMVDAQAKQQGALSGFQDVDDELETRGNCPETNLTFTDNTIFPASFDLDFGAGCNDDYGIPISGKITAVFDGLLLSPGTSINLSFSDDFVFDGNAVSGSYSISNQGDDANGQKTFASSIDGLITMANGKSFSYQASSISKQAAGSDTNFFTDGLAGIFDDVWSTTNEAALSSSEGLELNISTPNPINSPLNCQWPVSGIFSLDVKSSGVTGSIDFGEGNCDDKALLTIGDYSVVLEL